MAFFLIPFGKGAGKYWISAFLIIVGILILAFLAHILGNATNPILNFFGKFLHFLVLLLVAPVLFIAQWGMLGFVPVIVALIAIGWIYYAFVKFREKIKKKSKDA